MEDRQESKIRDLNPAATNEITLVAKRMRQTLVEVLGEEKAVALYSMDALLERVRWHLNPENTRARIFLCESAKGEILAHAIARIEADESNREFGYFSTLFVDPCSRKRGIASRFLKEVEIWFRSLLMPKIIYNTADNHFKLISLFERNGYHITHREAEMVQLTKPLSY